MNIFANGPYLVLRQKFRQFQFRQSRARANLPEVANFTLDENFRALRKISRGEIFRVYGRPVLIREYALIAKCT